MRFSLFACLLGVLLLGGVRADVDHDDGGIDEDISIEDTPGATTVPTFEKGNSPVIKSTSSNIFFEEQFQDQSKWSRWVKSQAKKEGVEESLAKYDGEWGFEVPQSAVYTDDYGLILKSKAKHHAITAPLNRPFDFSISPLVVQYEVKYQTNQECGGAYVKLLSSDGKHLDLKQVTDKTPYTIMFGPDMCGVEHKYHFIIRYRHPKTGVYSEHQAKKPTEPLDSYFTDKKSHLYTLVLSADNSFKMYIDNKLINSGNLLEDMEPPLTPTKEIIDESDRKPEDWDDQERISDTTATKPEDWDETAPRQVVDDSASMPRGWLEDESSTIPDPTAEKPEDWDDDTDGEWEPPRLDNPLCKDAPGCGPWSAPLIANPAYKGTWRAPLIDNPNYRGKWEPRKIPNPDYFEETHPYKLTPIGSVALELWSMVDSVVFDNFIITSDQSIAKQYADQLWYSKSVLEGKAISASSESVIDAIVNATKERPWLWAVYLVAVLLPIVILVVFCMSRSGSKTSKQTSDATKKRTDEPTSDDIEPDSTQQTSARSQTSRDAVVEDEGEDEEEEQEQEDIETDERPSTTKVTTTTTSTTVRSKVTGKDALESETVSNEGEEEENVGSTDNKNASPSAGNKTRRRIRKE